jgi:hypothetical protein
MKRGVGAIAALIIGALAAPPAMAYTIVNPHAVVAGKSVAEWTQDWLTWAFMSPAATNPILDTDGSFANVDNNGPVFFVAGTFLNNPYPVVTRTFDVPADKPILIAVLEAADAECCGSPPTIPGWTGTPAALVNKVIAGFPGRVRTMFASMDGTSVPNLNSYLERTGIFSMGVVQDGSLLSEFGYQVGDEAFPAGASGYYVMVQGLTSGQHVLDFGGSASALNASGSPIGGYEAIDYITVDPAVTGGSALRALDADPPIPEPASVALALPWLLGLLAVRRRLLRPPSG